MSEGVWFGDVGVAFVSDKDTDVSKEVIEKNFVGAPSQVYELTPNLESGSYSLYLNEDYHPRQETFEEQRDGIRSMTGRNLMEFPFELAGDRGFVLPESTTVSLTPSQEVEEAEIDLRFMDDSEYKSAIAARASPISDDFSFANEESIIAIPPNMENVQTDESVDADYSIQTEDGEMDLYTYSDDIFEYDLPNDEYTAPERLSPVRAYDAERNGSGNYGEDYGEFYGGLGEPEKIRRVYSDAFAFREMAILQNGVIMSAPTDNGKSELYYYDGSSWNLVAKVRLDLNNPGYLKTVSNYISELEFIDDYAVEVLRGFPVAKYTFSDKSKFEYETELDLQEGDDEDYYYVAEDSDGQEHIVIRTNGDGSFNQEEFNDIHTIEWRDINPNIEYEVYVGIVPDSMEASDLARYVFNTGNIRRTVIQR